MKIMEMLPPMPSPKDDNPADGLVSESCLCLYTLELADDKSANVLVTQDLKPLDTPEEAITSALLSIASENWFVQYEAIEIFRRALVHHSSLAAPHLANVLDVLQDASMNLRSTTSKNALLALAECFEYTNEEVKTFDLQHVIEAIMKRAACEKRFLRDAATLCLKNLATFVHTFPVLCTFTGFSTNKNSKLVTAAANATSLCLLHMQLEGESLRVHQISEILPGIAQFQNGKDAKAREDATRSLLLLVAFAETPEAFQKIVSQTIHDKIVAAKVLQLLHAKKESVPVKTNGLRAALRSRNNPQ
ncbi:hypothetical protein THRCLA_01791 [Thraustotheca clavata]|uniref:TOG domain-containing protein n=1 Tax=Thraustotheca clavata TaxID=74557 RepID=A0A1W0A788_9STRA|nr:hypothetical protein THRCLA_01791 [Thraustotheca clavata]